MRLRENGSEIGEDGKRCQEIRPRAGHAPRQAVKRYRSSRHICHRRHRTSEQSMKGGKEKESICLAHFCVSISIQSEFAPWQVIFLLLTEETREKHSAEVTVEGQRVSQIRANTGL